MIFRCTHWIMLCRKRYRLYRARRGQQRIGHIGSPVSVNIVSVDSTHPMKTLHAVQGNKHLRSDDPLSHGLSPIPMAKKKKTSTAVVDAAPPVSIPDKEVKTKKLNQDQPADVTMSNSAVPTIRAIKATRTLIGAGSFCKVYNYDNNKVVKVMKSLRDEGLKPSQIRECNFYFRLPPSTEQFLPFHFVTMERDPVLLTTTVAASMPRMMDVLSNFGQKGDLCLSLRHRWIPRLVDDVTRALYALHLSGILHRDIKPGNILYDRETKHFYLIDFGSSGLTKVKTRTPGWCTYWYTAPEAAPGPAEQEMEEKLAKTAKKEQDRDQDEKEQREDADDEDSDHEMEEDDDGDDIDDESDESEEGGTVIDGEDGNIDDQANHTQVKTSEENNQAAGNFDDGREDNDGDGDDDDDDDVSIAVSTIKVVKPAPPPGGLQRPPSPITIAKALNLWYRTNREPVATPTYGSESDVYSLAATIIALVIQFLVNPAPSNWYDIAQISDKWPKYAKRWKIALVAAVSENPLSRATLHDIRAAFDLPDIRGTVSPIPFTYYPNSCMNQVFETLLSFSPEEDPDLHRRNIILWLGNISQKQCWDKLTLITAMQLFDDYCASPRRIHRHHQTAPGIAAACMCLAQKFVNDNYEGFTEFELFFNHLFTREQLALWECDVWMTLDRVITRRPVEFDYENLSWNDLVLYMWSHPL